MNMEKRLRDLVWTALWAKLGHKVKITDKEWRDAVSTLKDDMYANIICSFKEVDRDYYINALVDILAAMKNSAA